MGTTEARQGEVVVDTRNIDALVLLCIHVGSIQFLIVQTGYDTFFFTKVGTCHPKDTTPHLFQHIQLSWKSGTLDSVHIVLCTIFCQFYSKNLR